MDLYSGAFTGALEAALQSDRPILGPILRRVHPCESRLRGGATERLLQRSGWVQVYFGAKEGTACVNAFPYICVG